MRYILFAWLLIYLLFPTHNSTLDAWQYAADIRHGNDLFSPHHLLYNAMGFVVYQLLQGLGIKCSALAMMKALNALFSVGILAIWAEIWKKSGKSTQEIMAYLFVAGATFGLWRFATENENYIVPIFFSSLGSFFAFANLQTNAPFQNKNILLSSFWAAVACLFHQIHFWWWLGLAIGYLYKGISCSFPTKTLVQKAALYLLPAFLVPITYLLVVYTQTGNYDLSSLMRFVLHDFYTGNVTMTFGFKHLLMTGINFTRSFIQLHGIMLQQFHSSFLWALPAVVFVGIGLYLFSFLPSISPISSLNNYGKTHLLIAILHFLFAIYSVGNAEFMVMLPLLLLFLISLKWQIPLKPLYLLGISLFVWNFSYGIFPNYYWEFQTDAKWDKQMLENPQNLYVLCNRPNVENRLYYHTGQIRVPNLVNSANILHFKGQTDSLLRKKIDSTFSASGKVFTNALHYQPTWSREKIMMEDKEPPFFQAYPQHIKHDSSHSFTATMYLIEVLRK
ncbi:MAG: hypothetical protein ACKVTZ_09430 [Bacteroidia bacterium]